MSTATPIRSTETSLVAAADADLSVEETCALFEDTGNEDTGNEDTGNEDTGNEDTGNEDTGNEDTGNEDTGNEVAGSEVAGSDDTAMRSPDDGVRRLHEVQCAKAEVRHVPPTQLRAALQLRAPTRLGPTA